MVMLRQYLGLKSTPLNFFIALLLSFHLQFLLFHLLFLHHLFNPGQRVWSQIRGLPTVNFSHNFLIQMGHRVELRTQRVNLRFEGTLSYLDLLTCPFFHTRDAY